VATKPPGQQLQERRRVVKEEMKTVAATKRVSTCEQLEMLDISKDEQKEDPLHEAWIKDHFDYSTIEHFHLRFLIATSMEDLVVEVQREQKALGSSSLNPYFKDGCNMRRHLVPINRMDSGGGHKQLLEEVTTVAEALQKWKIERLLKWQPCNRCSPINRHCDLSYWEWRLISFFIVN